MQLVWVRLPFLQPFIHTEYTESQILIHCVTYIYICRVGCVLYKHCHNFYDNPTGIQDNSAAHFSWWLKLWNNTFLRAALLESSVAQHLSWDAFSTHTVLMGPGNWQEYSALCRSQPFETVPKLCYSTASRMPQPNQRPKVTAMTARTMQSGQADTLEGSNVFKLQHLFQVSN